MNLYEKKIIYLHKEGGDKDTGNCGFVSFQCIPGGYKLTVQVRHLADVPEEKEIPVYFVTDLPEKAVEAGQEGSWRNGAEEVPAQGEPGSGLREDENRGQRREQSGIRYEKQNRGRQEQIEIGKFLVSGSGGDGTFRFSGNQEDVKIGDRRVPVDRITGIWIPLWKEYGISGSFHRQMPEQKDLAGDEQRAECRKAEGEEPGEKKKDLTEREQQSELDEGELRLQALEEADLVRDDFKLIPDKWEQLKQQYELLHPFGDEREFISMKPVDFVILRQEYQKLVNNSFLLHGYYNYRHIILGKDVRLGGKGEICFYLGVPGVFYEREKMVAVMFGFEGFETEGPVEIGKFGYYLRKVEI